MLSTVARRVVPVHVRANIPFSKRHRNIKAWKRFSKLYRHPESRLLSGLANLTNTILVGGCQRSGGTMLTKEICTAIDNDGPNSKNHPDDRELAGALVLAGEHSVDASLRWCLQTSYLNEHYVEYFDDYDFRLVWLIRNPLSVVRSMVSNWSRFALDELYIGSQAQYRDLQAPEPPFKVNDAWDKACFSYLAKVEQLKQIAPQLGQRVMVLDYDDVIVDRQRCFRHLYQFLDIDSPTGDDTVVHGKSLAKAVDLHPTVHARIEQRCADAYHAAQTYLQANASVTAQ